MPTHELTCCAVGVALMEERPGRETTPAPGTESGPIVDGVFNPLLLAECELPTDAILVVVWLSVVCVSETGSPHPSSQSKSSLTSSCIFGERDLVAPALVVLLGLGLGLPLFLFLL